MRRLPPRLICILLALALLSGCAFNAPAPQAEESAEPAPQGMDAAPVQLWLWSGEPMSAALTALAEDYNKTQPARTLHVRVFDSEAAMGSAMNEARPDLLLCSGERGAALYAQGKLRELSGEVPLSGAFAALDESVGRSFFPLGAEVPVLAVNAAAYLASPVTSGAGDAALGGAESLLSLAAAHGRSTGQPFFAADSWAELFALFLLQAGENFDARRETLAESERGTELYNALAEAAFARGLYTGAEDAATLVRRGYVVCALLPSRELTHDAEGLACYPAPLLEGGEALLPAKLWGLAVTAGSEEPLPGAEAFLTWLFEPERAAALALDEGLLPAAAGRAAEAEEGSLDAALARTIEREKLFLEREDEPWREHAADFDEQLRAALALLD